MLKNKSGVNETFKSFHKITTTQFNTHVKILRSDNGREYLSREFSTYLDTLGIIHQTTCPDTLEQNGVAEEKNQHLLEVAWALTFIMNIPRTFWSEAVQTAAYLINKISSHVLSNKSPHDVMFPNIPVFALPPKTFEYICYVHVPKSDRTKLDPKANKCVFLDYGVNKKGYKCFHPPTRRYFVSREVTFFESIPYFSTSGTFKGSKMLEMS